MTEMTKMLMSRKFVVCIPAESGGTIVNCSAVQSLNGEVQLTKAHAIDVRTLAKVFEGVSQIHVRLRGVAAVQPQHRFERLRHGQHQADRGSVRCSGRLQVLRGPRAHPRGSVALDNRLGKWYE
jgi:hypothetical protein